MVKNVFVVAFLLMILGSCKNTDYLSSKYGTITVDGIIRVEYYEGENYLNPDPDKKPNSIVSDKTTVAEIVTEINGSNNPGPWKGASWEKIVLVKKDTTLTYSTNGRVIGLNQSSGMFYKLKDDRFIERYFGSDHSR